MSTSQDLKKYKIFIRTFNAKTKEVTFTQELRTRPITKERAIEIAKAEAKRAKNSCWEIV